MADDLPEWLERARGGSREALGAALESCRRYLLGVAGRQLDPEVQGKGGASDVVQETFIEAQRDFSQFHGRSEAEFLAWLRHILLHNVGKLHRRYRAARRRAAREIPLTSERSSGDGVEPAAAQTSPSSRAAANEEAERLSAVLARLPEDYRRVIELRHREARSFREIGQQLGRSTNAARMLWVRAIEAVREELNGRDDP